MTDKPRPITLLQRLHKIMSEVDFIAKDKTNAFHKYKYASEQAIKETLHPKLVENGVMFFVDVVDVKHEHGNDQTLTTITVNYKFVDVATGEQLNGVFAGTGIDSGDKGLFKAITGCIKYALTSTFLIPTGDDPENDAEIDKNAPRAASRGFTPPAAQTSSKGQPRLISPNQVKRMWAIARNHGWKDDEVKEFLSGKGYSSSDDVTLSAYDGICAELEGGVSAQP